MNFPADWQNKPLGSVILDIGDGGTPNTNKSDYFGGPVPWVVIQDIKKHIISTKTTLTELGLNSCSAKLWPVGAVILSTGATIGEVGIAEVPLATKQGIHGIVCSDELSSEFLYYKLSTLRDFLRANGQGSTIREVRAPFIRTIPIAYPTDKTEQTKVAEVLSTVDRAIEQTEALIAKQQRIKTGLMQDLLSKGIDAHGNIRSEATHAFKDSPLGRIPVEWEYALLSHFVPSAEYGISTSLGDSGIPVLRMNNFFDGEANVG
ncbi:MAG: restriction endonuclease subunit S [Nitrosomonas sp.]|nr:restriction endonuclease subunit S [Nitrosomonas sp.]